jgi:hypothetical protein
MNATRVGPVLSVAVTGLVLLAACSDERGGDAGTATVDTLPNGVVHVQNAPLTDDVEPRWSLEPELVLGVADAEGPELFGQVKGIAPLNDGRIVVLDAQAQELRIFAPDGEHLRTFGGAGQGPGEFSDANGLLVGPDGLIRVNDPRNARLSFLDPDSGYVRSVGIEVMSWGFIWGAGIDSVGRSYERTLAADLEDGWWVIRVYDADGVWADTIRLEPFSFDPNEEQPGSFRYARGSSSVPFWPGGVRVLDPRGYFWGKTPGVNDYRIAQTTFAGDTLLIFETRRTPRPVPAAARDSAIEALRERTDEELDWSRIPAEKPIVQDILLDARGRIWVRVSGPDSLVLYDVFGRDGIFEGTAIADRPVAAYPPPVIAADAFYALSPDEFDVPYVVRARIRETGSRD